MASHYPHAGPPNTHSTNSDEMMDLEILQLQEELQRMRKQRALLQLRSEVAKEQQLLAEAQQSLKSTTPVVERPRYTQPSTVIPPTNPNPAPSNSGSGLVRGIKRSHSESSDANETENVGEQRNTKEGEQQEVNGRENAQGGEDHGHNATAENGQQDGEVEVEGEEVPPTFTVQKQYRGVNRKEYNVLIDFLESHFSQYERYYAPDERRIEEGLRHVSPDIAGVWSHYVISLGQAQPTWSEFRKFLMSRVPYTDPMVARRHYYGRTQRHDQTVREFSNHLGSWESHLEELIPEDQRIKNLWDRVLPEVRNEARPFQYQSDRLLDHVAHLQTVESRMPSRSLLKHKMMGPRHGPKNNPLKIGPRHPNAKKPRMDNPQGS